MSQSPTRSSIRLGAVAVAVAVLVSACSRTPPEPTPPEATVRASSTVASTVSSAAPSGSAARCIAKLPEKAPALPPPAGAACPADPDGNGKMAMGEVTFPDAPNAPKVQAELAKSPHDIERGLMYRQSMSDEQGMLFKLDGRRDHTFWMHNTCIALDMLFVEDDGLIVGIVEGAAPMTDTVRSVGCPSTYVLEVNGGWTRKRGVVPGQKITIPFSAR